MNTESLSLGLAFAAGLVSFLSPCILPMVPSYLGFVAGTAVQAGAGFAAQKVPPKFGRTLLFVLGFGLVFVVLGAGFAGGGLAAGPALPTIRIGAGVLVMAFGLNMVLHFIPFLEYERRAHVKNRPATGFGAILVGMAFGAGWTPCIGSILAAILLMAGSGATVATGILYLTVYTLGLGIPFLVLSMGMDRFKPFIAWLRAHSTAISWVSAVIMMVMGLLIAFGQMTVLARLSVQAGAAIQEWGAASANVIATHLIATLVYLVVFGFPFIRLVWASFAKTKLISVVYRVFICVWALLGVVLSMLDWTEVLTLVGTMGTWLQFQGL